MKKLVDVYISREVGEELDRYTSLTDTTKKDVVERALRKFFARPSHDKERVNPRQLMKVFISLIADKITIDDIRSWAFDNSITVSELNMMFRDGCTYAEVERIRIH